jgi:hypothetical protein
MSYAPQKLLDLRAYLKPLTGLPDTALGIVGDQAHDGGYHCGWDRRRIRNGVLSDYSWQESPRDWDHKSNAARALDIGDFPLLRKMTAFIVNECERGAPDTLDIRSIIYSPDGGTVVRWDRLRKHSGGDSSHRFHDHYSFFADSEFRDKTSVFRRFFGSQNMMLLQVEGDPTVYISDSVTYRHMPSAAALSAAQTAGFQLVVVRTKADLEALGGRPASQIPPGPLDEAGVRMIVREELDNTRLTGQ